MSTERDDHDQRFKVLLKEFFQEFLRCFFKDWAARFDFSRVEWLDKEVFLDPPSGEKRQLDLIARLRIRDDAPPLSPGRDGFIVLVHIEVESADSVQSFRPRMFEYYVQLRRQSQLPVFPIGLYLRVGLEGVGWDTYEETFWEHRLLRFEFAYVGLPALSAEKYIAAEELIGAALSTLMSVPAERRTELHLEALKRIAISHENDYRKLLLAECVEAYSKVDEGQRPQFDKLLDTPAYGEVKPLMNVILESARTEGKLEGRLEGRLEERRETLLAQLEAKFGPLPPDVVRRVATLGPEELRRLSLELLTAESLKALRLQD